MAELQRIRASAGPGALVAALSRDGAVIVEDLVEHDLLTRFNAELDPLLDQAAPDHDGAFLNPAIASFFGHRTRHVTGVTAKSPIFATEILVHPLYLAVAEAILGGNCARYQLNLAHVLDRGPGSERQYLHRDQIVWVHVPEPHAELQLASILALVDFTVQNGATVLAPGSHQWEKDRQPVESDLVAAEMRAGSAVIYLGSTVHGGGANITTSQWRRGMHLSYVVGWLRTEENHYLTTPPDVARRLPRLAQEVLGYAAHDAIADRGGYLGTVELRNPVDLMAEGRL